MKRCFASLVALLLFSRAAIHAAAATLKFRALSR
jgi:hypothetical protein